MENFSTFADFNGMRRPDVALYVLTSGGTASAAEEFAYDVQTQKRGTLVGETTYGGANPGQDFDAGDGFTVFVSTGAAINPVTHTNWDGAGMKPDIKIPAADALVRAQELALQVDLTHARDKDAIVESRWALQLLEAEKKNPALVTRNAANYVGHYGDRVIAQAGPALISRRGRFMEERLAPLGGDDFAPIDQSDRRLAFQRNHSGHIVGLQVVDADGEISSYPRN